MTRRQIAPGVVDVPDHELSAWLRQAIAQATAPGRPCQHLADGSETTGLVVLAEPNSAVCRRCPTPAATDCDRCRTDRAAKSLLVPVLPWLWVRADLCRACYHREGVGA